jgi:hypothetical protein
MREQIRSALEAICATREVEARWLHTVSMLEFIGARKISRTVADRHPSLGVLQHLADETRHALAFKRLACEVAGREVSEYLCLPAAATYFQTLDRELAAWGAKVLGREDVRLSYLLTTTMIEQRAMMVYPLYKAATRQRVVRDELAQVVTEEQSHRREIEDRCKEMLATLGVPDLSDPLAIEERLFAPLIEALRTEALASAKQPAA